MEFYGFIVNPSLIIGPGFWNSGIGTIIKKSKISGPFYAPGSCGVIDVNDLTKIMDTSDDWIQSRSGIKERRWSTDDINTSDLDRKYNNTLS